jgi:hypothetical protein
MKASGRLRSNVDASCTVAVGTRDCSETDQSDLHIFGPLVEMAS